MQQFAVPQFIDVEPKVIGPITVRQFIMLIVGGLFIFIAFKLSSFLVFVVWAILIASVTITFAFARMNSRPFHFFLLSLIGTFLRPRVRTWVHDDTIPVTLVIAPTPVAKAPRLEAKQQALSRLRQLSLIVDTGGAYHD